MKRMKGIVFWAGLGFGLLVGLRHSEAQSIYLPLGAGVSTQGTATCPTSRGFPANTTCTIATVNGCPNAQDLQFLYHVYPAIGQQQGTIVLLSGFGGTSVIEPLEANDSYVSSYTQAGFQVFQFA